jgi:hypothetical protein
MCPLDCTGAWTTAACVAGQEVSTWHMVTPANALGSCPAQYDGETRTTNCMMDCIADWSTWSECSSGQRSRTYIVDQPAYHGGIACTIENGKVEIDTAACPQPIDCVADWSAWTECNPLEGLRNRTFIVTTHPANGGAACLTYHGAPQEEQCDIDCIGSWSGFGDCIGGTKVNTYNVTQHKKNQGVACDFQDGAQISAACPIDCVSS